MALHIQVDETGGEEEHGESGQQHLGQRKFSWGKLVASVGIAALGVLMILAAVAILAAPNEDAGSSRRLMDFGRLAEPFSVYAVGGGVGFLTTILLVYTISTFKTVT